MNLSVSTSNFSTRNSTMTKRKNVAFGRKDCACDYATSKEELYEIGKKRVLNDTNMTFDQKRKFLEKLKEIIWPKAETDIKATKRGLAQAALEASEKAEKAVVECPKSGFLESFGKIVEIIRHVFVK